MGNDRYFPKKKVSHKGLLKTLLWVTVILGVILLIYILDRNLSMETTVFIRVWARKLVALISIAGVITMAYAFTGCFTKNKTIKIMATTIVLLISILGYLAFNNKPIKIKEDKLYILPKTETK